MERQPIHYAAQGGHAAIVEELVDNHGVDPEAIDAVYIYIRFKAIRPRLKCCFIYLQEGITPIHCAAMSDKSMEVATLLLDKYKVNPSPADFLVKSPIMHCYNIL